MPETTTPSIIINTSDSGNGKRGHTTEGINPYRTLGIAVGVAGVLYYGQKAYNKWKQNKSDQQYGADPASQKAVAFRNAFNPSGFSWLIDVDTTNTTAVLDLVSGIKSKTEWDAIVAAYNKGYNESIVNRINSELNQEQLIRFNEILLAVTTGKTIPTTTTQTNNGTVTLSWTGKRIKMTLNSRDRNIKYWANESEIGVNGKGTEILIAANAVHVSRVSKVWIVKKRKKISQTIGGSFWPVFVPSTTVTNEVVQIEYPGNGTAKYLNWFNASSFELF